MVTVPPARGGFARGLGQGFARPGGVLLALAVVLAGLWWLPLPLVAVQAGPVSAAHELIEVDGGAGYQPRGALLITTVLLEDRLRAPGMVGAWLDPERDVVARERYFPGGVSTEDQAVENVTAMAGSQDAAVLAALRFAGLAGSSPSDGARVVGVYPGGPAEGRLAVGDVIESVDGVPVTGPADVAAALRAGAGEAGRREVVVGLDGGRRARLRPAAPRHPEDPGLGVRLLPARRYAVDVGVQTGPIGGPSAGLALALAIIDALDAEDRTGGRRIAVTGTLDAEGRVGPVGGIRQKVHGARAAGATLFVLPEANLAEARRVAGTLRVVGVASLAEAVAALQP